MSIITKYIDYLKNNPEQYWFKRKLYGWGWTPATWQGWLAVLIYLLIVVGLALCLDPLAHPSTLIKSFVLPLVVVTVILIGLAWYKGESPRWQWGLPKEKEEDTMQ
jgi:uncharacterized membrane protein YhaH (DUF805 family)